MKRNQIISSVLIIVAIVLIDQLIKIYVKTHFVLRESYEVASWFYLSFIENDGMAYGMKIGSKVLLTSFRIVAVGAFVWYLLRQIRLCKATWFFVVTSSMVIAGAIGNIIDCIFYGRWFTSSVGRVATWADEAAGIQPAGEWFKGLVVDMFHFPLIRFDWPDSFPHVGESVTWLGVTFDWPEWLPCSDEPFLFFKPVFNFADAAISVGVALLLIAYCVAIYREKRIESSKS